MAIIARDTSPATATPTASASQQPSLTAAVPSSQGITVDTLANDDAYLNTVRDYMSTRLGAGGQQREDEDNSDYVERFLTHMRSFENRSLELAGQIDFLRQADEQKRKQFLNAYTIYNNLPGFASEGGGSALSAIGDYAYYNVVDPINLVGLGVGSIAAKQAAKQGVKGLMKGLAVYGSNFLTEGVIGGGMDLGLQRIEKESGVRDEYDFGRAGTAAALSGAGSVALQGAGDAAMAAFRKSPLKRDLRGELVAKGVEAGAERLDNVEANIGRIDTDRAQLAEFDDARGRNILDQIGDVKNPDLVEAKVRDEVDAIINDVGERLFTDPTSGLTLGANEKVSDAIFRVLQDKDAIKQIDETALAGALNEAGVNPEQFAQIYRTTVRESAQQLNALSQLAKKLRGAGSMDTAAYSRVRDYFDQKPENPLQKLYSGALYLDRNRRAFLVSQIPTLIRNVYTTGIRGSIDTGANILDAFGFYAVRKAQQKAGKDVPTYTLNMALSDAFGLVRNAVDQDFSEQVVKATLGKNPKLLEQISRNVTDIGDGQLSTAARMANFLNMTHDGLVRRAIYASSVEKQIQRITGKTLAETLATDGAIPTEIMQKAVREALEFTYADMPTDRILNPLVKTIEALPFIGTGIFTFPRFTASALKFTGNYVMGGHLVQAGYKLRQAVKTGNERALNEGMTNLSKGLVGGYFLFEAVKHRADNQDIKWYEYKDDEGKTGDLRPLFPLAPYLLVADFLVKWSNDTLDRLSTQEVIEGILGTRLAGAQLYVIDQFYKSFSSEAQGGIDSISGQRAAEAAGTMLGELIGGPINTNILTGLVRDISRTFDTEEARVRDVRRAEGQTAGERFTDALGNAITRNTPYMNRDKPALESPTREGDMFYQSPLATTFTGVRKSMVRNELEAELVRLGIQNRQINPSTGDSTANALTAGVLGDIALDLVRVDTPTYERLSDAAKVNYLMDRFSSAREIATQVAKANSYSNNVIEGRGEGYEYTPFDRSQWIKTPARIRKEVNEYFKKAFGGTVEELGAFRAGVIYGNTAQGRFK